MKIRILFTLILLLQTIQVFSDSQTKQTPWWWENNWWDNGIIKTPNNHKVSVKSIVFKSRGQEIPALVIRPEKPGRYYPVLFQHGRRGLDEIVKKHAIRLAARGFVVLAADIYKGNFINNYPIKHDYELEKDVNQALSTLMTLKNIKGKKACSYSHTRGGYYTLKVAVRFKRQEDSLACYVSYYPHWQDPNAPEPLQVYSYAPEINQLTIPVLVMIGDQEQYHRRRVIESSVKALLAKKQSVRLIIYPGVGRGFDFRPVELRTFADDLAAKDAIQRSARFIRKSLAPQVKKQTKK